MGRETQDTRGQKYASPPLFLSLLLNWRPNLGLFGPNAAPHLSEKGVWGFPMLSPPFQTDGNDV